MVECLCWCARWVVGPVAGLGPVERADLFDQRLPVELPRRTLVHVPAEPLSGIDPTGAGDAFAATYVLERSRRAAPRVAAQRATRFVGSLLARTRR